ncbi:hypothetical protein QQ045_013016 [Rhodiola kirilowii]
MKVKGLVLNCDRWLKGKNRIMCSQPEESAREVLCDGSYDPFDNITGYVVVERKGGIVEHVFAGWSEEGKSSLQMELEALKCRLLEDTKGALILGFAGGYLGGLQGIPLPCKSHSCCPEMFFIHG